MQISLNTKNRISTSFNAKLSPALREMIGEYRETLRQNKQFDEFVRLRKTMIKIKFLCPGQEISDKFILNNNIPLIKNFNSKYCDNKLLESVLEKLTQVHNLNNT